PQGACAATVSYADPTTTGSCGTVICSPASGSSFPVGVTTVSCTASVGSNPHPSCSFTVTVKDTEKPQIACGNVAAQSATANSSCQASVPDVTSLVRAQSSDNCTAAASLTITQNPTAASTVSGEG